MADVPSIIVPFSNNQFAWAHRAYDLGVGSKPTFRRGSIRLFSESNSSFFLISEAYELKSI